jgi:hypothetical protein
MTSYSRSMRAALLEVKQMGICCLFYAGIPSSAGPMGGYQVVNSRSSPDRSLNRTVVPGVSNNRTASSNGRVVTSLPSMAIISSPPRMRVSRHPATRILPPGTDVSGVVRRNRTCNVRAIHQASRAYFLRNRSSITYPAFPLSMEDSVRAIRSLS